MKPSILECICSGPGFCPIFGKTMGTNPPDWAWCQKSSPGDRQSYFDLLVKAPPSSNQKMMDIYQKYEGNKKWFFLDYLTLHGRYNHCEKSNIYQKTKNKKIQHHIDNHHKKKEFDNSSVEILILGHADKQFESIIDRNYLKKININEISSGIYSENTWSESRAFLLTDIFHDESEWIGTVSASWNLKYESFSRIDNLHNWHTTELLINSKPEDKLILCADITCPCIWFDIPNNVLSNFVGNNDRLVGHKFLKSFGFKIKHIKVPASHQMICHKNIYFQYVNHLLDNNIFGRMQNFIDDISKYFKDDIPEYSRKKLNGYFMEMFNYFWFADQDMIYIPNAERRVDWYYHGVASNIIN
jgi:hypothetical protein